MSSRNSRRSANLAVASSLVALAVGFGLPGTAGAKGIAVTRSTDGARADVARIFDLPRQGETLQAASNETLELVLPGGGALTLAPGTRIRVDSIGETGMGVTLLEGTLRVVATGLPVLVRSGPASFEIATGSMVLVMQPDGSVDATLFQGGRLVATSQASGGTAIVQRPGFRITALPSGLLGDPVRADSGAMRQLLAAFTRPRDASAVAFAEAASSAGASPGTANPATTPTRTELAEAKEDTTTQRQAQVGPVSPPPPPPPRPPRSFNINPGANVGIGTPGAFNNTAVTQESVPSRFPDNEAFAASSVESQGGALANRPPVGLGGAAMRRIITESGLLQQVSPNNPAASRASAQGLVVSPQFGPCGTNCFNTLVVDPSGLSGQQLADVYGGERFVIDTGQAVEESAAESNNVPQNGVSMRRRSETAGTIIVPETVGADRSFRLTRRNDGTVQFNNSVGVPNDQRGDLGRLFAQITLEGTLANPQIPAGTPAVPADQTFINEDGNQTSAPRFEAVFPSSNEVVALPNTRIGLSRPDGTPQAGFDARGLLAGYSATVTSTLLEDTFNPTSFPGITAVGETTPGLGAFFAFDIAGLASDRPGFSERVFTYGGLAPAAGDGGRLPGTGALGSVFQGNLYRIFDGLRAPAGGGSNGLSFFPETLLVHTAAGADTGLLVGTRGGDAGSQNVFYRGELRVDGAGDAQRSSVTVATGTIGAANVGFEGGAVGSTKSNTAQGSLAIAARVGSQPANGIHYFGGNPALPGRIGYAVLGSDDPNSVAIEGVRQHAIGQAAGAEVEVLRLASRGILGDNAADFTVALQPRPAGSLNGFAAGLVETATTGTGTAGVYGATAGPSDFSLTLDPGTNRVAARMALTPNDIAPPGGVPANLSFDFGGLQGAATAPSSAYIDAARFGARASAVDFGGTSRPADAALVSGKGLVDGLPDALLGATAVDAADLRATMRSYEHVQWGFFIADVDAGNQRRDHVHLGSWAAGRVPTAADLIPNGTGTYTGHAVGQVFTSDGTNPGTSYLAAGRYSAAWNFGLNSGTATIANFDGQTYNGAISSANRVGFQGTNLTSPSGRTGTVTGSFFDNNPSNNVAPRAMGGNFSIRGRQADPTSYAAQGTFAAERRSFTP